MIQLVGSLTWGPELFGHTPDHPDRDKSFDDRDSAPSMLKCRVIDPAFTWEHSRKPAIPWSRTLLYEMHAGPLPASPTARSRAISATSAELLPIHAFVDDSYLVDKGMRNYWGYNSDFL